MVKLWRYLLVLTLVIRQTACQNKPPVTTRATAMSTVTLSGSGAVTLSEELQAAADEANKALEENPNDLTNVLQSLATSLVNAITGSVVTVLNDDDYIAAEVAGNISAAVEQAFLSIADSSSSFSDLDIDFITSEINSKVEQILSSPDASKDITETTKAVAEEVLGAIAEAFSEISGSQFTFTSTVEVTTTSAPSTQTIQNTRTLVTNATASATNTTSLATSQGGSGDLLASLTMADVKGTVTLLLQLQDERAVLVTFFLTASTNPTLSSQLVNVFVELFQDARIPERDLVDALGQAYASEGGENITSILGKAIAQANESGDFKGLLEILIYAFTQVGPALDVFTDALKYAINEGGCQAVNSVLISTKTTADKKGVGIVVSNVMDKIPEIRACLEQGVQIEISGQILAAFSDIEQASTLVQSTAEQGQTVAIADAFIQALNSNLEQELSEVLVKFFQSAEVSPQTISVIITLTVRQGGREALSVLLGAFGEIEDKNQLVMAFSYALTSGDVDLVDTISTLIKSSIKGDKCGLASVMDGVFAEVTSAQTEQISALLQSIDAEQCLPVSLQVTPAVKPIVEPVDSPAPQLSPEIVIQVPIPPIKSPTPTPTPTAIPQQNSIDVTVTPPTIPRPVIPVLPSPLPSPRAPSPTPIPTPTPTPAPSPPTSRGCNDVVPPGGYSCEEQAAFGKCQRKWMRDGGFCAKTCKFCTDTCFDIPPDSTYSCFEQKAFGKCQASWMIEGGYCRFTCGLCIEGAETPPAQGSSISQSQPTQSGFGQQQPATSSDCPQTQPEPDTCVQCCECPAQLDPDERTRQLIKETVAEVLKATEK